MLKVISLLKRREDMSFEDFATWVVDDHAEFAKQLPGLRKYVVNVARDGDGPFDSANELYFDDEDARATAFGTEAGKAAGADAAAHTSQRVHLATTEHAQL
jgi:uncharacterized protein (TIGR02118 family)